MDNILSSDQLKAKTTEMETALPATRILIVDDDEDDFFITSQYIKSIEGASFIIDWCFLYREAIENITQGKYDLYLVDYRLGANTGLELIEHCIKNNCDEPFILLTGEGNREIDRKAMETGAVDYLAKGELTTEKLERCIRYSLERSASIKALRANERKFRNIFERSKDTVFIADENLVFTEVNEAATSLFEYSKNELLTKNLYHLLENKENEKTIDDQLDTLGEVPDNELEMRTKKGEKKHCIVSLSKEKDIKGDTYIQGIIHDITSLKRAEKTTLQMEKLGVAARLVRILAHEVRNPLNNINLAVEQLHPDVENEDAKLYLDIVDRNSKRIGDLVSELLNSSRPGEMRVEKKPLQKVLDESLAASMDRIMLKHIQLEVDYPSEAAWIMADSEKLKIAFLNIIINAVEAMPEENGRLSIAVRPENSQYSVTIHDNGAGISEENLAHLFEPYFTSKRNGMGLGLASTLMILQAHKAVVDVQSDVDQNHGTTFKLVFDAA